MPNAARPDSAKPAKNDGDTVTVYTCTCASCGFTWTDNEDNTTCPECGSDEGACSPETIPHHGPMPDD